MKRLFNKLKHNVVPTPAVPRTKDELNNLYNILCARLGENEYRKHVLKLNEDSLNNQIRSIDLEMVERSKLDQAAAPVVETKDEVKNVES